MQIQTRLLANLPGMDILTAIFSALGLSASAGLNAYIPLLIMGLVNRFTGLIELSAPYDLISNWWVIGTLLVLIVIEVFADNAPIVNHINDLIQTFVRPSAGALAFAASTDGIQMNPVLAVVAGLLVAGSVHTTKAVVVRPAITATTGGLANPPVSIAEDLISASVSFLALAIPILVGVLLVVFGYPIVRWVIRLRRRKTAPSQ